jgi:hypothetical protein
MIDKKLKEVLEVLNHVEHAPNVQMHQCSDAVDPFADSDDDEATIDARPATGRRRHLAEYFDEDENEAERIDTGRLDDFVEPPDACCGACGASTSSTSCGCGSNPFVKQIMANGAGSRF